MGRNGEEGLKGPELRENPTEQSDRAIAEEDLERAHLYALLARVLAEPMGDETLEVVRAIEGKSDVRPPDDAV